MADGEGERTAGGRPTRAETRRRVLDAAYAVFGERGIAASSLSDVAAAAGLTKGAIYSSFTGKDEMVLALMEERVLARATGAVAGFPSSAGDHEQAVSEVGRTVVEASRDDATAHRLLMEYFAMSHRDPGRRAGLRRSRRAAREAVTGVLVGLRDEQGLPLPLPPEELAIVVMALSNGLAIESGIDPDAVPDDLLGRLFAAVVRGA